ncbi:Uncharacterised protein [Lysinibacillus sphaericus]|nr:Uncharacterised protein [Lysinibacillus sphaericus]
MKAYIQKRTHVKYLAASLLTLLLLTGCQSGEGKPEAQTLEVGAKEAQKTEIDLPKSDEEWKALAEESRWFEPDLTAGADISELLMADLMGDQKPEAVIPYILQENNEGATFGVLIGSYDESAHDWSLIDDYRCKEKRLHINEIQPLGKMTSEKGKDVIFLNEELVSATTVNTALHVFRMDPDEQTLIHSAEFAADYSSPVKLQDNQLTFSEDGNTVTYKREDVNWLRGNGYTRKVYLKQAPSVYEESLMQMLGDHTILQARVDLVEGYEQAKSRLGIPQIEADDLGGLCAQYDDFNFCNNGQDNQIVHISLQVEPIFTIEDVKQYLGEPDEKYLWDIQEYYYVYNYNLGDMEISYSTETEDPDSQIEEIVIMGARSEELY